MSPEEIHILLNHYALEEKGYETCSGGLSKDFYDGIIARFSVMGLLEYLEVTPMGKKLVEMICDTPMPVLRYEDPRTL